MRMRNNNRDENPLILYVAKLNRFPKTATKMTANDTKNESKENIRKSINQSESNEMESR